MMSGSLNHPSDDENQNDALNDALSRITASLVAQTLDENGENIILERDGDQKNNSESDIKMGSSITQENSDNDSSKQTKDVQSNRETATSRTSAEEPYTVEQIDNGMIQQNNDEDNNNEYNDYNDVINNLVGNIFSDIAKTTEKSGLNEGSVENTEAQESSDDLYQLDSQNVVDNNQNSDVDMQIKLPNFLDNLEKNKSIDTDNEIDNIEKDNNRIDETTASIDQAKNAAHDEFRVLGMEAAISKIVSETVQQISSTTTEDEVQTNDIDVLSQRNEKSWEIQETETLENSSKPATDSFESTESTKKLQDKKSSGKNITQEYDTEEGSSKATINELVEFNMDEVIAQAVRNTIEATAQVSQAGSSVSENLNVASSEDPDVEHQIRSNSQSLRVDISTDSQSVSQSDLLISGAVNEIIKQAVQHSSVSSSSTSDNEAALLPDLYVEGTQIHSNDYDANNYDGDVNIAQVVSNVVDGIQHLNDDDAQATSISINSDTNMESIVDEISSQNLQLGSSQMLADAAIAQIVQNVVSAVSDASNKKSKKSTRKTTKRQSSITRTKKTTTTATQRKVYPSIPLIGVTRPSTVQNTSSYAERVTSSQAISNSVDVDEFQAAMDEMIRSVADAIISDNHNRSATPITLATAQQLNKQQAERQQKEQEKKQQDSLLKKKKRQELSKSGRNNEHQTEKKGKALLKQSKSQEKEGSKREKTNLTEEEKQKKKEARQLQKQQEKIRLKDAKKLEKQKHKAEKTAAKTIIRLDANSTSNQETDNLELAIDEVVNNVIGKSFKGQSTGDQALNRTKAHQTDSKSVSNNTSSNASGRKLSKKSNPTLIDPEILKKRELARTEIEKRKKARELKKEELKKKQLEKAELKAQKQAKALEISKAKEEKRRQFEEAKKRQEEEREKAKLEKEKALEEKAKLKEAKEKRKREKLERREERRTKREEKEKAKAEKEKLKELRLKEKEEAVKKREERKRLEDEKKKKKEERKKKKEEEFRVKQEKIRLKEEKIKLREEKANRREERKILKQAKLERRQERLRLKKEKELQKLKRAKLREEKAKLKEDKANRREERRRKKLRNEQLKKDKQLRKALGTSYSSSKVTKPSISALSTLASKFNKIAESNSDSIRSAIETAISSSDSSVLPKSRKQTKHGSKKHSKKDKNVKLSKKPDSGTLSAEQEHARAMTALANEYASTPYLKDLLTKHLANNLFAAGLDLNVLSSRIAAGLSKFKEYMNNGSLAADLSAQSSRASSNNSDIQLNGISTGDVMNVGNRSVAINNIIPTTAAIADTPSILGSNSNITEVIASIKRKAAASVSLETTSKTSSLSMAGDSSKQVFSNGLENRVPKFSSTISTIVDRIIHRDESTNIVGSNDLTNSSQSDSTVMHTRKYSVHSESYNDGYGVDIDMVRPLKRKSPNDISANTIKRPSIKRAKYNNSGEIIYDNSDQDVLGIEDSSGEGKAKFHIPKLKSIGIYNARHTPILINPIPLHNRLSVRNISNLEDKTQNNFSTAKPGTRPSLAAVFAINSGRLANTGFGKLKMKNRSGNDKSARQIDAFRRHTYKSLS